MSETTTENPMTEVHDGQWLVSHVKCCPQIKHDQQAYQASHQTEESDDGVHSKTPGFVSA